MKRRCSVSVEKVGTGKGDAVDIAVDIEGTRMTAMGQANALAVMAVGDKGCASLTRRICIWKS